VTESVLKAIQNGQWDFEPEPISEERFQSTKALPGSPDKVKEMAVRVKLGLPLWHSKDRRFYDEDER